MKKSPRPYRMDNHVRKVIMSLPAGGFLETKIINDRSLEVLLRIEKTMRRMTVMGEDESRFLWVETKNRRIEWMKICSAHCNNFHYLMISLDCEKSRIALSSSLGVHSDRKEDILNYQVYDVYDNLLQLEGYIATLVDCILQDPSAYNLYIDRHFSYYKRRGVIRRSVLNNIVPDYRFNHIDGRRAIEILSSDTEFISFREMTLRIYMHYWRLAAEVLNSDFDGMDDIEAFKYSSKGYVEEVYNLDSEDAFRQWIKDVSSFHGFDLVYARVHFYPLYGDGRWTFILSTHSYWNLDQYLQIAVSLYNRNLPVVLENREKILSILLETDCVRITPDAYRYLQSGEIGNEITLPTSNECISKASIRSIIAQTEWEEVIDVKPYYLS